MQDKDSIIAAIVDTGITAAELRSTGIIIVG